MEKGNVQHFRNRSLDDINIDMDNLDFDYDEIERDIVSDLEETTKRQDDSSEQLTTASQGRSYFNLFKKVIIYIWGYDCQKNWDVIFI